MSSTCPQRYHRETEFLSRVGYEDRTYTYSDIKRFAERCLDYLINTEQIIPGTHDFEIDVDRVLDDVFGRNTTGWPDED